MWLYLFLAVSTVHVCVSFEKIISLTVCIKAIMTNRVGSKKVLIIINDISNNTIYNISNKRPIKCNTNHNLPLALKISLEDGLEITLGLL